ncbi:CHAT domain-containing protein [Anabaena sp. CS-542/02]|uniref:CHAT domain-containing protein n=1 Tax=Anabaena sp. CS-542/02 TaxID=3021719 RepID=UPI00233001D6|nr:tetratricopeptide repeat protein [Anabaena sp. CS-542/02]MDB9445793.1 tetratricopeptide repeat protein [Anabaena sp. CS-542/02]
MLTQLFQRLNKFFKHPMGHQSSPSFNRVGGSEVAQPLPELSNADLEFLFTQLLEGVQQGRGKQWAVEYLQRMENRISVERWINWLVMFGEKLLLSPESNRQLARQMIQLGQMGIGKVSELADEIGIRLLTREWGEHDKESETRSSEILNIPLESGGKELIPTQGEFLWDSHGWRGQAIDTEYQVTGATSPDSASERLTDNTEEVTSEYTNQETTITAPNLPTPFEKDVIPNLVAIFWESQREKPQIIKSETGGEIVSSPENWQDLLVNLDANVAHTLHELFVQLNENINLVQQLADYLSPAIIADSDDLQAQEYFYQGLQQGKTGDLVGAVISYNQAIAIKPDAFEYWFNKGLTLFHLEDFAEAVASYDQAVALKPNHYKSWYNRGVTLGELGEFEAAIASFNQAIEIQPQNPEAWSGKGLALLKLGQISESISSYDQALDLEPQDPYTWYYRGIALAIDEKYLEAITSYDKAIAIQPDFHEVWIDRGVVLFNLGNWNQAIASWDQALATQPDLYLAWYNRGIALERLGNIEEAIASYDKAIVIKPDFHLAWHNQGLGLFYLSRFAKAIISYDHALEVKLDYWEAWIGRATAVGHLPTQIPLSSLTGIAKQNPALQLGGYEGRLASLEEGLKYIQPDTHPEGWGRLHIEKGNTYYDLGKKLPRNRYYWSQAIAEYNQALLTLTTPEFSELHLEVLQSLIRTYLAIGQTAQAQELQQQATDLLTQLLISPNPSEESRRQLALKFSGIAQLGVDLAVECGEFVQAWEMAEQGKNSCLNWLLFDSHEHTYTHYYTSVQQLLNPHTAIIYWHISPVALHTFIIKYQAPSPILVFTPIQDVVKTDLEGKSLLVDEVPLAEGVRRLIKFERWLEDWDHSYQEYLTQGEDQQSRSHHVWRMDMTQKLWKLQNILQISTVIQELKDITQLILIPHRDLHRLPLHALFSLSSPSPEELPSNLTISYLPSVQTGLSVQAQSISPLLHPIFLGVESAKSTNCPPLEFAQLEAEIISKMFNNSQLIQGANATKSLVANAVFNKSIFHFSGSVINCYNDPKTSALVLVDQDKITLEEIRDRNLNSYQLVTLAAGETAVTKNQNITREYVDLASGFLCGGVPYVVSSLWTVESSARALVMIEFYRRLQINKSPVRALNEATLWLKELTGDDFTKWYEDLRNHLTADKRTLQVDLAALYRSIETVPPEKLYSHPYYWAGYTIKGVAT